MHNLMNIGTLKTKDGESQIQKDRLKLYVYYDTDTGSPSPLKNLPCYASIIVPNCISLLISAVHSNSALRASKSQGYEQRE